MSKSAGGLTIRVRELPDLAEALATALDLAAEPRAPRPRRVQPVSPTSPPAGAGGQGEFSAFSES